MEHLGFLGFIMGVVGAYIAGYWPKIFIVGFLMTCVGAFIVFNF